MINNMNYKLKYNKNIKNILKQLELLFDDMEHFITPKDERRFKQFVIDSVKQTFEDARDEEYKRLIGIVDEVRNNYDKGIFRAITSEDLDKIHLSLKKDFGISLDRLSAFYARWICDVIKKHFSEYSK